MELYDYHYLFSFIRGCAVYYGEIESLDKYS